MRVSSGLGVSVGFLAFACAAVNPQAEQARSVGSKQMSCPEGQPEAKLTAEYGDMSEWEVGCNFESVLVSCQRGGRCILGKLPRQRFGDDRWGNGL